MKTLWLLAAIAIMALFPQAKGVAQTGSMNVTGGEKRSVGTLHLYGPGGPLCAIKECAALFSERTGIDVQITAGTPPQWIAEAKQNGDLIYEGAEFMLNDFMQAYPGLVDESSITGLCARSAEILVRKGNPKNIRTIHDLAKKGVKIMAVTQEKMEEVYGRVPGIQYNMGKPVLTGAEAERSWRTMPELDAWITYESWHYALRDETDVVELQDDLRVVRITPVAIMKTSRNSESVKKFVHFLKSEEAHKVFQRWGWK